MTCDYDDQHQLTGADSDGSQPDENYTYNDNGNRTNTGHVSELHNLLVDSGIRRG